MSRKILIIDGLNNFIRNFVINPSTNQNGEPIGGVVGFMKTMKNIILETTPDLVVVAWDGEGGSRRRRGIFAEYKAGRKVRVNRQHDLETVDESSSSISSQLKTLRGILDLMGVIQINCPEVEADDVIAFLCNFVWSDDEKVIVSTDKDFLQLVSTKVVVYSPTKKVFWNTNEIITQMGCLPENYIYVKALLGDRSDNIKGVGKIGEKSIRKLFPMLEQKAVASLSEIIEYAEANVDNDPKYKSLIESKDKFAENVKLMSLSNPIFGARSAEIIRTSATKQKPRFSFMELKLEMIRHGINIIDPDFVQTFRMYKVRYDSHE